MPDTRRHPSRSLPLVALALLALIALSGCAQTRQAKVERQGFLSESQWELLEPTEDKEDFELVYEDPDVDWNSYDAVLVDSVSFWRSPDDENEMDPEDEQMILEYFYAALHREVGERTTIVEHPGAGVARLRIAITGADDANVTGRVVTTVVPQFNLLSRAGGAASDSTVTVGEAAIAAKLTNSMNDRLLAAVADRRIGQKAFKGMTDKWADIKNAIDIWAEKFAARAAARFAERRGES